MVKPLNKEWELFGPRYRVQGAKGDKVDCNACQKQVSAAVNRLQSHLRVCPARASLPGALLGFSHQSPHHAPPSALKMDASAGASLREPTASLGGPVAASEAALTAADAGLAAAAAAAASSSTLSSSSLSTSGTTTAAPSTSTVAIGSLYSEAPPPAKKPRVSSIHPSRDRAARLSPSTSIDDLLLSGLSPPPTLVAANSAAYAKRRLEIEEKRLELELKRDSREARREQLQLEILEAQARKEKALAKKEAFEAKVLLALSRKQLRDQGVDQEEIDRVLPVATVDGQQAVLAASGDGRAESEATAAGAVNGAVVEHEDATF